jgi:hypothetical protein
MRRLICLLAPLLVAFTGAGQVQHARTEIVVVGTVHEATAKYTAQDLLQILQKVRPDVVLYEYPADMMTPDFEFKSVAKGSLEQEAVLEYVKQSGAKIRPYDIDGRNVYYARTNFFARQKQCNEELDARVDAKKLTPDARGHSRPTPGSQRQARRATVVGPEGHQLVPVGRRNR